MHLSRAHNECLVELVGVNIEERSKRTATNHVGTCIAIAQQARGNHVGNELLHRLPRIVFVAQSLHQRTVAHLPARAIFVESEAASQFGPAFCLVNRARIFAIRAQVGAVIVNVIAAIKLETVDGIIVHHAAQRVLQIVESSRIGEVEAGTLPVPPRNDGRISRGIAQQQPLFGQRTIFGTVGRDKRTDPQHHLEALPMQAVNHGARVGKAFAFEIEIAIITLPIIVDHQDAGGQIIVEQVAGIGQNVVLVLVVHQLYPRVVLWM